MIRQHVFYKHGCSQQRNNKAKNKKKTFSISIMWKETSVRKWPNNGENGREEERRQQVMMNGKKEGDEQRRDTFQWVIVAIMTVILSQPVPSPAVDGAKQWSQSWNQVIHSFTCLVHLNSLISNSGTAFLRNKKITKIKKMKESESWAKKISEFENVSVYE